MVMRVRWSRGPVEVVATILVGLSKDDSCNLIIPMPLLCFVDNDDIEGNVIVPREDREENDRASSHHAKARAK